MKPSEKELARYRKMAAAMEWGFAKAPRVAVAAGKESFARGVSGLPKDRLAAYVNAKVTEFFGPTSTSQNLRTAKGFGAGDDAIFYSVRSKTGGVQLDHDYFRRRFMDRFGKRTALGVETEVLHLPGTKYRVVRAEMIRDKHGGVPRSIVGEELPIDGGKYSPRDIAGNYKNVWFYEIEEI